MFEHPDNFEGMQEHTSDAGLATTVTTETGASITVQRDFNNPDGSICLTSGYSARGLKIRFTRIDARLLTEALRSIFEL